MDGRRYSGSEVQNVRWGNRKLRARWQAQPTRSAKRRLKKWAGRESRFARHVNHGTSKQIVAPAKGTGRGIRMEELNGIRTRAKVRHRQRGVLHSWAFWQWRQMMAYQAALAGVLVEFLDTRNTPRTCSKCGPCEKGNRGNQREFRCRSCGHEAHADIHAAESIGRAAVNRSNMTWFRIVAIRFASGGFPPQSQALASRQGWFTYTAFERGSPIRGTEGSMKILNIAVLTYTAFERG